MTVHYVPAATGPTSAQLGHLVVTTDDLDRLLRILERHDVLAGVRSPVVRVHFTNGVFTEGKDIVSLPDAETSSLRVVGHYGQVALNETQAEAFGSQELCDDVVAWANGIRQNHPSGRQGMK